MPLEYESILSKNQEALIEFLNVDLKLAETFVKSALLAYSEGHLEHYQQAKRSATRAVETVERLKIHVVDLNARNEIGEGLASLKKLISAL
jgi:hypothetical protein